MSEKGRFLCWGFIPEEGEMVTWLGVHAVKWRDRPELPSMAFKDVSLSLTEEERKQICEIIERAEQREKDEQAALESCSWGMFQIMGYHWKALGYSSIVEFVSSMYKSEAEHLKAFVRFIQVNDLAKYLKNKDWAGFAERYNGSGYAANQYDKKMAAAYARYKESA